MDIFNRVTLSVKECYTYRTTRVKSPQLALPFELYAHRGGWEQIFADLCSYCVTDLPGLLALGIGGADNDNRMNLNITTIFALSNQLLTELATRILPRTFEYPYFAVGFLSGDAFTQQEERALILKDFYTLLQVEKVVASASDDHMHLVLADVQWRMQESVGVNEWVDK